MVIARAKPVLEHERRHFQRVEPLGDLPALMIAGQHPVTAAGTDHNRGARGGFRLREPDRQGRNIVLRIIALGPGAPPGQRVITWWSVAGSAPSAGAMRAPRIPNPRTALMIPSPVLPFADSDSPRIFKAPLGVAMAHQNHVQIINAADSKGNLAAKSVPDSEPSPDRILLGLTLLLNHRWNCSNPTTLDRSS